MSDPRQRKKDRQQQEAIKGAEDDIIRSAINRQPTGASSAFAMDQIFKLRLGIMEKELKE